MSPTPVGMCATNVKINCRPATVVKKNNVARAIGLLSFRTLTIQLIMPSISSP